VAAAGGLRQSTISRIWRTFGLKPHLVDSFKLSREPQFIEKVRDVVGLYLGPPEQAIVQCLDEKSQIQELGRSAPVLPMMPGMPEQASLEAFAPGVTEGAELKGNSLLSPHGWAVAVAPPQHGVVGTTT
jgi:hypothetical protein